MQKLIGLTVSILFLGFTVGLTLANPIRSGVDYGMKKGWFKSNRNH